TDLHLPEEVFLCSSLSDALQKLAQQKNLENIFVIGGGKVFTEAIEHPDCSKVYLTHIEAVFDCDTFFPGKVLVKHFTMAAEGPLLSENGLKFKFLEYERLR